jgi:hypothetical protein
VFIGEIEVLFAEHDTIITVPRNDKHIDFFICNLSIFAFNYQRTAREPLGRVRISIIILAGK